MRCAACGYDSDMPWNYDTVYGDFAEIASMGRKILYVCPKCGTVRAE